MTSTGHLLLLVYIEVAAADLALRTLPVMLRR